MQDMHMYDGNGIMFSMEFISNETQRVRFESGFEKNVFLEVMRFAKRALIKAGRAVSDSFFDM